MSLPQGAGDGVRDVSGGGAVVRGGVGRVIVTGAAPLGRHGAGHPHAPAAPPLAVSVARPFLQDGLQVAPQAALRAVVAAGGQLGDLERRVGFSVTAPLDGLEFSADAVHGVVTARRLRRAAVHGAGGRPAGEQRLQSRKRVERLTDRPSTAAAEKHLERPSVGLWRIPHLDAGGTAAASNVLLCDGHLSSRNFPHSTFTNRCVSESAPDLTLR